MVSHKHITLRLILSVFLTSIFLLFTQQQLLAQEEATGRLYVRNTLSKNILGMGKAVLTELYYHGKVVRSTELGAGNNSVDNQVEWSNLVTGEYEIHFSARGFGKFVKRITISSNQTTSVMVEIEKDPVVMGRYPSIEEILSRLEALLSRMKALEQAVNELKKE